MNEKLTIGTVILIIAIIGGAFYISLLTPQTVNGQQQLIVRTKTETSTATAFLTTLSTTTETTTSTATSISIQIVTQTLPTSIQLSGTVTTKGPGTTPTKITFAGHDPRNLFSADVTNGQFTLSVANGDIYSIKVDFSLTPAGAGSCNLGPLILDTITTAVSSAYSC